MKNIDNKTVEDFGEEWNKYNQTSISDEELKIAWNQYFEIFLSSPQNQEKQLQLFDEKICDRIFLFWLPRRCQNFAPWRRPRVDLCEARVEGPAHGRRARFVEFLGFAGNLVEF